MSVSELKTFPRVIFWKMNFTPQPVGFWSKFFTTCQSLIWKSFWTKQVLEQFMNWKIHVLIHFTPWCRQLLLFVSFLKIYDCDGKFPEKVRFCFFDSKVCQILKWKYLHVSFSELNVFERVKIWAKSFKIPRTPEEVSYFVPVSEEKLF